MNQVPNHPASFADYACHPNASRGRIYNEVESESRTPHQRDRDRILHSSAFRKLQYKTQVFVYHEGDYFRTRLTHSLEVSQVTRAICRTFGLNEDLGEAIALAHDLGHPPFSHAGEDALDLLLTEQGGFDHNDQTLRIITLLEQRYPEFDGLNLTWETLEGLAKHNGPLTIDSDSAPFVRPGLLSLQRQVDLDLDTWPSLEAQIASLADDIAYTAHDIDDGLRSGLLTEDDLRESSLICRLLDGITREYPELNATRRIHTLTRRLIHELVRQFSIETQNRLERLDPKTAQDIREAGYPVAAFRGEFMAEEFAPLKRILYEKLYRHHQVNLMRNKTRRCVRSLFEVYMEDPTVLPEDWVPNIEMLEDVALAQIVTDYISGMTDRFALRQYEKLFQVEATA